MLRQVPRPTARQMAAARAAVSRRLPPSPLLPSPSLLPGCGSSSDPALLKVDCLNPAGSFKLRGALAAIAALPPGGPVVTASAGNHGTALALAAAAVGSPATVVVSRRTDAAKLAKIRRTGCDLVLWGEGYDEAERHALELAAGMQAAFISPYNDPWVIAGQGTIGHELTVALGEDLTVVVPVGGGGLAAGVALAIGGGVTVGVEAERSAAMTAALAAGRVVGIEVGPTLADALAGNLEPDTVTLPLVREHVERVVTVSETEIAAAMRYLYAEHGLVVEGAGAVAVAALRAGKVRSRTAACVAVVTGRNVDPARYAEVIAGTAPEVPPG